MLDDLHDTQSAHHTLCVSCFIYLDDEDSTVIPFTILGHLICSTKNNVISDVQMKMYVDEKYFNPSRP